MNKHDKDFKTIPLTITIDRWKKWSSIKEDRAWPEFINDCIDAYRKELARK